MSPGRLALVLALFACAGASSCTVVKPLVGAVTGPFIILGNSTGDLGCGGDGRAVVCAFAVMAGVGAVGGLVTGVISDVQVLMGRASNPSENWWDPFAINR